MSNFIRSAKQIIEFTGEGAAFHFSAPVEDRDELLSNIGFEIPLIDGDDLIPKSIGKFTNFNANGKEVVREDLPKETVHKMVWGTTRDWHGNQHSQLQNRKFFMYPREWIDAPEEALRVTTIGSDKFIISKQLISSNSNSKEIVHLANMFLEIFGEYSLINKNLKSILPPIIKKLNWKILPPGEHPFGDIQKFIHYITENLSNSDKRVAGYRLSSILSHKPDFIAIGNGGFHGYTVMGFQKKNLYVLESPIFGNATYIFKGEWELVSKLSKKDIIRSSLHTHRLIHSKGWRTDLRRILD